MSKEIHPIVRFAIERRVTMGMIVLGVMVMGWISLTRLPLEFLPSFSSSSITVIAPYPSSSPEEVERLVVRPLEDCSRYHQWNRRDVGECDFRFSSHHPDLPRRNRHGHGGCGCARSSRSSAPPAT